MPASNQTNIFVVYVNIQYNLYKIFINTYFEIYSIKLLYNPINLVFFFFFGGGIYLFFAHKRPTYRNKVANVLRQTPSKWSTLT